MSPPREQKESSMFRSLGAGLVVMLVIFASMAATGAEEIQVEIPYAQPALERAAPGARLSARVRRANQKLCEEYGCVVIGDSPVGSAQTKQQVATRHKMRDGEATLAIPSEKPFASGALVAPTPSDPSENWHCRVPDESPVVVIPPKDSSAGSVAVEPNPIDCGLTVRSNIVSSSPTGGKQPRRFRAPRHYKWAERGKVYGEDLSGGEEGGKRFLESVDFDSPALCLWSCVDPKPPPPICLGSNYYRCDCRRIGTNVGGWVAAIVKEPWRGYWQAGSVARQDWSSDYSSRIQCSIPSGYPYYKTHIYVGDRVRWGWELQGVDPSWGWTAYLQAGILPVRKISNDTWAFTRYHWWWPAPINDVGHFFYNYTEAYFDALPVSRLVFNYKQCKYSGDIAAITGNYFACDYYIRGW